jgi:hypothetical protein
LIDLRLHQQRGSRAGRHPQRLGSIQHKSSRAIPDSGQHYEESMASLLRVCSAPFSTQHSPCFCFKFTRPQAKAMRHSQLRSRDPADQLVCVVEVTFVGARGLLRLGGLQRGGAQNARRSRFDASGDKGQLVCLAPLQYGQHQRPAPQIPAARTNAPSSYSNTKMHTHTQCACAPHGAHTRHTSIFIATVSPFLAISTDLCSFSRLAMRPRSTPPCSRGSEKRGRRVNENGDVSHAGGGESTV